MIKKIEIGIDPGVHTGFAIFDPAQKYLILKTLKIHQGFLEVLELQHCVEEIEVTIENPNLWTHFKNFEEARHKLQGAGSVKRDFSAWTDFLDDNRIRYKSVRPDKSRNALAKNKTIFRKVTGYEGECSEHARVAAMLVWR